MRNKKYKVVSTTIGTEFYHLAKSKNICFAEALRVGLSVLLSSNINKFDNNINRERKLELLILDLNKILEDLKQIKNLKT